MKAVDLLLINPPFHMRNGGGSFFPLGLSYIVSAVEDAGYTWDVIDCAEIINSFYSEDLLKLNRDIRIMLSNYSPAVIGIGPSITTQLRALKIIASSCREILPNVPVFAGGPLASIDGQEWLFYDELGISYLIKGDGEKAVVDALQAVKENGDICQSKCVSYKGYSYTNYIEDINSILFPYRNYIATGKFSIRRESHTRKQAPMITSRGCPYACSYCVSGNMKSNKLMFRKRNIDNIIQEMSILYRDYGVGDIVFYDDCFFPNISTVNEDILSFCRAIKEAELDVFWQIEMRPDFFVRLSDEAILCLSEAKCRQINLGIEKVSAKSLSFIGKYGAWDGLKEKICLVKGKTNIAISATFILGGGRETIDEIKDLIEQSKNLKLDFAHYNPLFIYPGTPVYSSRFDNKKDWARYILADNLPWGEIVYENDLINREQLIELSEYAYSKFYEGTSYQNEQMVVDRFNLGRIKLYDNI